MNRVTTLLVLIALTGGIAAHAQKSDAFPTREDSLLKRVEMFDALMRANHWNEGTMMQQVIFPPAGLEKPLVGSQEDVCGVTAVHMAAYSYWYAVTGDEKVRGWANGLFDGIMKLEKVTGVPGVVARTFNKTDKPLWHEQVYFFPQEWHASTSMPGYRWQGDLSSDKFVNLCYAMGVYHDICADDKHKQMAADFIDRFVGRCVDKNFRLVDVDNKTTLWGNFCPDVPHEPLNSLEMLAGLKTAYHLTGKDRYRAAYRMLIDRYHYDEHAMMARVLFPPEWTVPWDDTLAGQSYYQLFRYETDPNLLNKYRTAINRHWFAWKDAEFNYDDRVWYHMLYQVATGEEVLGERWTNAAKSMWGFDRRKGTFTIPTDDGPKQVESELEGEATSMIHNYWFGRYYEFIDAAW